MILIITTIRIWFGFFCGWEKDEWVWTRERKRVLWLLSIVFYHIIISICYCCCYSYAFAYAYYFNSFMLLLLWMLLFLLLFRFVFVIFASFDFGSVIIFVVSIRFCSFYYFDSLWFSFSWFFFYSYDYLVIVLLLLLLDNEWWRFLVLSFLYTISTSLFVFPPLPIFLFVLSIGMIQQHLSLHIYIASNPPFFFPTFFHVCDPQ